MYIAFNLYSENENGTFLGISDTLAGLYNYLIDEVIVLINIIRL